MKSLTPILLLLLSFSFAAEARLVKKCELALAPTPLLAQEVFSDYVQLPSGSELYVRIQRPRFREVKGWYFMVHGLMDSHRAYDAVTKRLLRQGYGVVRMDLHGFARSLHREAERARVANKTFNPSVFIDYHDQVRDLKELLVYLRDVHHIERPHVVGHSMGGGIAIALLADPAVKDLVGPRATVIAPYVYRLEYYLMEKILFRSIPVGNSISRLQSMVPSILQMGPEFFTDTVIGNAAMSDTFGIFFDKLASQRLPKLNPKEWEEIRKRHIDSAIGAVKGLRHLNSIDKAFEIPNGITVDLIYGHKDKVVEETLARRLGRTLVNRGGQEFALDAGHMSLSENPDQVAQILIHRSL